MYIYILSVAILAQVDSFAFSAGVSAGVSSTFMCCSIHVSAGGSAGVSAGVAARVSAGVAAGSASSFSQTGISGGLGSCGSSGADMANDRLASVQEGIPVMGIAHNNAEFDER